MHPSYNDITDRIQEDPKWYTKQGFPRYDNYFPGECNIYFRYGVLYMIKCQDCHKEFLIGMDYATYDMLDVAVPKEYVSENLARNIHTDYVYLPLKEAVYFKGVDDMPIKEITIEEKVKSFGFGDPPSHGCVGDTMGSIDIKTVEVWDKHFGQVVENGRIFKMGSPARLEELEELDLRDEWAIENGY